MATGKNIDNKMMVDSTFTNIFVTLRIERGLLLHSN